MQQIKSRGIRGIAYDPRARTLDVQFSSSKTYRYFDVPASVYEWLTRVESKGRFVNRLIKDKYRYERLDGPEAQDQESTLLDSLRKSLEDPPNDE